MPMPKPIHSDDDPTPITEKGVEGYMDEINAEAKREKREAGGFIKRFFIRLTETEEEARERKW